MIARTIDAVAGEQLAFGAPAILKRKQAFACRPQEADGIVHRTRFSGALEKGEPARIVVDGDLQALVDGQTRWAIVRDGAVKIDG